MFTLTVYLVQRGMLVQMFKSTPPGMPNVFLLDITAQERDAMFALLRTQSGVVGQPEIVGTVQAKLVTIDSTPFENMPLQGWAKRFQHPRSVTSAAQRPVYADVIEGAWWDPNKPAAEPEVAVSEEAAHALHLHPGTHLTWSVAGQTIAARVACVQRIDSLHMNGRIEFIFRQGMLDGLPVIYYGSVRMEPKAVAALPRASYERFPTVTVINVADVLEIVQQVVDQIALVVRFISGFAILAGAVILASSVAGTRFRRVR